MEEVNAAETVNDESDSGFVNEGEGFELGDWSITINDFIDFTPSDDGNVYFVVELTVTNNGTNRQDFIPMFSIRNDLSVELFYHEDFRYTPSGLIGHDDDLSTMAAITALATRTGILAFSVPPVVVESDNSLGSCV